MRTEIKGPLAATAAGAIAESVLRSCVHCGMCNATCPTYHLTGDELDGPRGRIYLIKQTLEGEPTSRLTQVHLDRCLSCRACEEPPVSSGVEYHRLLDVRPRGGGRRMPATVARTRDPLGIAHARRKSSPAGAGGHARPGVSLCPALTSSRQAPGEGRSRINTAYGPMPAG